MDVRTAIVTGAASGIDRALARHRSLILPGGRLIYALRRLSPALMWSLVDRLDR